MVKPTLLPNLPKTDRHTVVIRVIDTTDGGLRFDWEGMPDEDDEGNWDLRKLSRAQMTGAALIAQFKRMMAEIHEGD